MPAARGLPTPASRAVAEDPFSPGLTIESSQRGTQYRLQRLLGRGSFGEVWLCAETATGEKRAVKIMQGGDIASVASEVEKTKRAHELIGSFHVATFYEASLGAIVGRPNDEFLIIVLEYIDGLPLNCLVARQPLPEVVTKVVMHDVLLALARLHEQGIIHRDIKSGNVIISPFGACYVCDFGVSSSLSERRRTMAGTLLYMAPELLFASIEGSDPYDCKVDIWAAGILAVELATGRTPWQHHRFKFLDFPHITKQILLEDVPVPSHRTIGYSRDFQVFVKKCLVRDPRHRASAAELLSTRYMTVQRKEREFCMEWLASAPHEPPA